MLVLMAIEDMLADLGCTSITVAATIDKALGLIATNEFDLATLDLNLNGQRSYPIAKALEEHDVPFAFSTGYGTDSLEEGYARHPVLNKPFTCSQLVTVITGLLEPSVGVTPALG